MKGHHKKNRVGKIVEPLGWYYDTPKATLVFGERGRANEGRGKGSRRLKVEQKKLKLGLLSGESLSRGIHEIKLLVTLK